MDFFFISQLVNWLTIRGSQVYWLTGLGVHRLRGSQVYWLTGQQELVGAQTPLTHKPVNP